MQVTERLTVIEKHPIASPPAKRVYTRFAILLPVAVLVAVAAATPSALEARDDPARCNTGSIQCCAMTEKYQISPLLHAFALCANHGPRCSRLPQYSIASVGCSGSPFPLSTVSLGSAAPRSRSSEWELILLVPSSPSIALTTVSCEDPESTNGGERC
jgi:hypothetical protein